METEIKVTRKVLPTSRKHDEKSSYCDTCEALG